MAVDAKDTGGPGGEGGRTAERFPSDLERVLDPLTNRLLLIGLFVYPIVLADFIHRIMVQGWRSNIVPQAGFYLLMVAANSTTLGRRVREALEG